MTNVEARRNAPPRINGDMISPAVSLVNQMGTPCWRILRRGRGDARPMESGNTLITQIGWIFFARPVDFQAEDRNNICIEFCDSLEPEQTERTEASRFSPVQKELVVIPC